MVFAILLTVETSFPIDFSALPTVEALATDMRTHLYIPRGGVLEDECTKTVWKRNDDGRILGEIDDNAFHPNAIHALRYCHIMWTDDWKNYKPSHLEDVNPDDGVWSGIKQKPLYENIGVVEEF